jgi:hypothetical protein
MRFIFIFWGHKTTENSVINDGAPIGIQRGSLPNTSRITELNCQSFCNSLKKERTTDILISYVVCILIVICFISEVYGRKCLWTSFQECEGHFDLKYTVTKIFKQIKIHLVAYENMTLLPWDYQDKRSASPVLGNSWQNNQTDWHNWNPWGKEVPSLIMFGLRPFWPTLLRFKKNKWE